MPRTVVPILVLPLAVVLAALAGVRPVEARDERAGTHPPPSAVQASDASPVVRVDPGRGLGSPDAPLALVEFADFQCPYCRRFHLELLPRLRTAFIDTGRLRYFYKDFPLPYHEHAVGAAVAARCAAGQGRYWEMVDALYAGQARLGPDLYRALAARLGLEPARFGRCLGGESAQRAVRADLAEARRLGVRATPSFVIGRLQGDRVLIERAVAGIASFELFAQEIELLSP